MEFQAACSFWKTYKIQHVPLYNEDFAYRKELQKYMHATIWSMTFKHVQANTYNDMSLTWDQSSFKVQCWHSLKQQATCG